MVNWPLLGGDLQRVLRLRHVSLQTERSYLAWFRRFRDFIQEDAPLELDSEHVVRFLSHLATTQNVAPSTQNQAFSALLFLFRNVLSQELDVSHTVRAKERRRLPVVLAPPDNLLFTGSAGWEFSLKFTG